MSAGITNSAITASQYAKALLTKMTINTHCDFKPVILSELYATLPTPNLEISRVKMCFGITFRRLKKSSEGVEERANLDLTRPVSAGGVKKSYPTATKPLPKKMQKKMSKSRIVSRGSHDPNNTAGDPYLLNPNNPFNPTNPLNPLNPLNDPPLDGGDCGVDGHKDSHHHHDQNLGIAANNAYKNSNGNTGDGISSDGVEDGTVANNAVQHAALGTENTPDNEVRGTASDTEATIGTSTSGGGGWTITSLLGYGTTTSSPSNNTASTSTIVPDITISSAPATTNTTPSWFYGTTSWSSPSDTKPSTSSHTSWFNTQGHGSSGGGYGSSSSYSHSSSSHNHSSSSYDNSSSSNDYSSSSGGGGGGSSSYDNSSSSYD